MIGWYLWGSVAHVGDDPLKILLWLTSQGDRKVGSVRE